MNETKIGNTENSWSTTHFGKFKVFARIQFDMPFRETSLWRKNYVLVHILIECKNNCLIGVLSRELTSPYLYHCLTTSPLTNHGTPPTKTNVFRISSFGTWISNSSLVFSSVNWNCFSALSIKHTHQRQYTQRKNNPHSHHVSLLLPLWELGRVYRKCHAWEGAWKQDTSFLFTASFPGISLVGVICKFLRHGKAALRRVEYVGR